MKQIPKLTDAELQAQYDKHIELIKTSFGEASDRTTNILQMYEDLKFQIINAPASGKINYHACWKGGYLFHINNVVNCALEMAKSYKRMGGDIDFTKEELMFSAIFHDLGKIGTEDGPYYIEETSEWHKKNMGRMFVHNDDVPFLNVFDATMYLLQKYNISMTKNELTAIKLANGMYSEENVQYLKYERKAGEINNLCHLLHFADHMATIIEKDLLR